jgi:prevent-host-death family protein
MNYHSKQKRVFSTADLSRHIGDVTQAAGRAPITITHHNKPRYVMMSVEDFERINPQKAYSIDDMPESVADMLIEALDDFLSGKTPYEE